MCVLHGLGGIGKTQLAIDFARRYKAAFSAIFWLDGRSEDQLKQSFARCFARIPELRTASCDPGMDLDSNEGLGIAVSNVMEWLARPSNTQWLLIFDNVDQDYKQGGATGAYNIQKYFPEDHGSILITTRLLRLQQLGRSLPLTRVGLDHSRAILQAWYGEGLREFNVHHPLVLTVMLIVVLGWDSRYETLLELLQGLPLALAQAASYLRETGMDVTTYTEVYNQQWQRLMGSDHPLTDYHQESIATTWAVSLDAIKRKSTDAIKILRLWACLDNKQFWHGLLQVAKSMDPENECPSWLLRMGNDLASFADAISLLLRYSMIQTLEEPKGNYAMHPVVHRWALHLDNAHNNREFARLALVLVGHSIPTQDTKEYWVLQRRLLPHAEKYYRWVQEELLLDECTISDRAAMVSIHKLGILYSDQGKFREAEAMYKRALESYEKALGHDHISTLGIINNLGIIYKDQGKLGEAEAMYKRALEGYEKALGCDHISALDTAYNLGILYRAQSKPKEAEAMYKRVLEGYEMPLD